MGRPTEEPGARTRDDYQHPSRRKKRETLDWLKSEAGRREIEEWADAGARHGAKRDGNKVDGLGSVLYVFRHFGSATADYSTGELEKLAAIVIKRLIVAERELANRPAPPTRRQRSRLLIGAALRRAAHRIEPTPTLPRVNGPRYRVDFEPDWTKVDPITIKIGTEPADDWLIDFLRKEIKHQANDG